LVERAVEDAGFCSLLQGVAVERRRRIAGSSSRISDCGTRIIGLNKDQGSSDYAEQGPSDNAERRTLNRGLQITLNRGLQIGSSNNAEQGPSNNAEQRTLDRVFR
jgi:hypothetical protein